MNKHLAVYEQQKFEFLISVFRSINFTQTWNINKIVFSCSRTFLVTYSQSEAELILMFFTSSTFTTFFRFFRFFTIEISIKKPFSQSSSKVILLPCLGKKKTKTLNGYSTNRTINYNSFF